MATKTQIFYFQVYSQSQRFASCVPAVILSKSIFQPLKNKRFSVSKRYIITTIYILVFCYGIIFEGSRPTQPTVKSHQ
jgi:hypothetical protein